MKNLINTSKPAMEQNPNHSEKTVSKLVPLQVYGVLMTFLMLQNPHNGRGSHFTHYNKIYIDFLKSIFKMGSIPRKEYDKWLLESVLELYNLERDEFLHKIIFDICKKRENQNKQ